MALYQIIHKQNIPATIDEVWKYISSPMNLRDITPAYMNFRVTSLTDLSTMYPGLIISYKVSPLFKLPISWVTEITHVSDQHFFVDEQRSGPYKMWHHEHHIKAIDGGVEMTDIVSYIPPFGILGQFANALFIKRQLKHIFAYREKAIEQIFGPM